MSQSKDIELEISKIKNLPPLPEASIRIITAVNDPDISIEEMVSVLALSPVLVARLLGLANSAYFGRSGQISDLRIAIIQVLGLSLVKSFALSIVLNVELQTTKCKSFEPSFFWSHALVTALIAQKIALHLNDELIPPNIAYTSGLLLNIGLLAAIQILPETLNDVLVKADHIEGRVSAEMKSVMGKNQYEIGCTLLGRWKLPTIYQIVLEQFRQNDFQGNERRLVLLLELSHWAAIYIVDDKIDEMPGFLSQLQGLSFSEKGFLDIIDSIYHKKDDINELASVIGG